MHDGERSFLSLAIVSYFHVKQKKKSKYVHVSILVCDLKEKHDEMDKSSLSEITTEVVQDHFRD